MKTKKIKLASVFSVVSVVVAVIALIVMAGFNVKVMAAPSVGTGAQVVNHDNAANLDEGYKTGDVTESKEYQEIRDQVPEVQATIDQANHMLTTEALIEQLRNEPGINDAVIRAIQGKTPLTEIFDLSPRQYQRQESDGCYHVTLYIPAITESTSGVIALHYSTVRNVWETIAPEKEDLGEKLVTLKFQDLSPVMILADRQVAEKKSETGVDRRAATADGEDADMNDGSTNVTITSDGSNTQEISKSDSTAKDDETTANKSTSAKDQKGLSWLAYLVLAGFFATVALVLIVTVILRV